MSRSPEVGERAPDVRFEGPDGPVSLAEAVKDGPLVLLFFQEASTPACESELRGFASEYDLIQELGGRVLAVSVDPAEAQQRFAGEINAPFPILSDRGGAAARAFGVLDESSGRSNRAVFVLDQHGTVLLAHPWYNPSNSAQFEDVFAALGLAPDAGF